MLAARSLRTLACGSRAQARGVHTVLLMRHGESIWNLENKFTGWYDVALSERGHVEAAEAGQLVALEGLKFDMAFTSTLKRAIRTLDHALEQTDLMWVPVVKAWQLNERHYGDLTGLDKQQTVDKHGIDQVTVWRRSYDVPPPPLDAASEHYPGNDSKYQLLDKNCLPKTESLATTAARVIPYWQSTIVPELKQGKKIIIAAHGNSLRALVQYLDGIPNDVISELNIPTATPLLYYLDDDMKPIKDPMAIAPLTGRYLGDQAAIKARIDGVKNQTK
ncbi:histidine phosphatase superfamily [Pelagophyceae sp. CCMP2097]|nr:histidine phosphatase superfamily [Pelagophyceae sp. CCMP2097]